MSKWQRYKEEKRNIEKLGLSPEEFDRQIRNLCAKYRI